MSDNSAKKNNQNFENKYPVFLASIALCTLLRFISLVYLKYKGELGEASVCLFIVHLGINTVCAKSIRNALELGISYSLYKKLLFRHILSKQCSSVI